MKKILGVLLVITTLMFGNTVLAAAQLGRDFTLLNPVQPVSTSKIAVQEFFFYECSHCYHLHGPLSAWEKTIPGDVELTFVPTIFRESSEPLARTYFALESMGKINQLDDSIYKAIHEQKVDLHDLDTIGAFLGRNGVDRNKFAEIYNSFSINSKVARARQMIRSYRIEGTPTLVVDGTYVITGLLPVDTIRTLNDVIEMVRKARKADAKMKSRH